jgi:hypothetical protein
MKKSPDNKRPVRKAPLISALEPRMLFDGAALVEASLALDATPLPAALDASALPTEPGDSSVAPEPTSATQPRTDESDDAVEADAGNAREPTPDAVRAALDKTDFSRQVLVIDDSVSYSDKILAAIPADWQVIRVNSQTDGLAQVLAALQGQTNLSAIHVLSHGGAGRISLGSTALTAENLATRSSELQRLGEALAEGGDLLIYGCEVAADGFVGQQFVDDLARLTSADVAASDDTTGQVLKGGDWRLEVRAGEVQTDEVQAQGYTEVLPGLDQYNTGGIDVHVSRWSGRLNYQASQSAGDGWYWGDQTPWVDSYTNNRQVAYFGITGWWWIFPLIGIVRYNYGAGVHYGTSSFTLTADSSYQLTVAETGIQMDQLGGTDWPGYALANHALYKGTFDRTQPLKNLVSATQGWTDYFLFQGELEAGNYTIVSSFDNGFIWWADVISFMTLNDYAEQFYGNFRLDVNNLNRAPVWTTRDLNVSLNGEGEHRFNIPWSLNGNATVTDPDGDELTLTAALANGNPLPAWLSFNPNDLSFTGNPPANTGALVIRLTAHDGQRSSTRDFTVTYTADNDRPVLAAPVADQRWDGQGSFTYTLPSTTFTDADPGADSFSYTATLADGSPLPSWLSLNPNTGVFSGNPPALATSLSILLTANDGSGQLTATQTDTFTLLWPTTTTCPRWPMPPAPLPRTAPTPSA